MEQSIVSNTKTCSKCHKTKLLDEFYNQKTGKDGKRTQCKKCSDEESKKYREEHKEKVKEINKRYQQENQEKIKKNKKKYREDHKEKIKKGKKKWYQKHKDEIRQKNGTQSMYENKLCPAYLGIVIGERLIRHLFNDVEVMPYGFPDYDFICNKGKKINVKTACITFQNKKYPRWKFRIDCNTITDFFIIVAFDNLTNLNPLYLWMIPGKELNHQGSAQIRPSTINKWDEWKRDINDAQLCCTEMKNINNIVNMIKDER